MSDPSPPGVVPPDSSSEAPVPPSSLGAGPPLGLYTRTQLKTSKQGSVATTSAGEYEEGYTSSSGEEESEHQLRERLGVRSGEKLVTVYTACLESELREKGGRNIG